MFEFLKNSLYVMEGVAAVTSFNYIKKWNHTYWKWFPFYLSFIVCADLLGEYFATKQMYDRNYGFVMYFVIPSEFSFFFWIFHKEFKTTKNKWLPTFCFGLYMLSLASDILYFRKSPYIYLSFSYTIGNILLLVLVLRFFLQLMNSNKVLQFRQNILFWVSSGLLVYYLGSCPYYGLRNLLVYKYYDTIFIYYSMFVYILNCLMYLTFALSFICGKPNS